MWALRDAATAAGHHDSAVRANAFYARLAEEVNGACGSGAFACGPRRDTLIPPWRSEFIAMTWGASLEMFFVLSSLGHPNIAIEPSMGTVKQLDAFRRVIHGRLARAEDAGYRGLRMHVARWVTPLVVTAARFALPAHEFS